MTLVSESVECPLPNGMWDSVAGKPLPIFGFFCGKEDTDPLEYLEHCRILEGERFDQEAHLDHIDHCQFQARLKEFVPLQRLLCETQAVTTGQAPSYEQLWSLINRWADYWMLHTPFIPSTRTPFWDDQ